jgi:hypothetical protein
LAGKVPLNFSCGIISSQISNGVKTQNTLLPLGYFPRPNIHYITKNFQRNLKPLDEGI